LPTGTSISFYYSKNHTYKWTDATWITIFETFNTANAIEKIVYKKVECNNLQLKLVITPTGTTRPFIKSVYVTGSLINKV